MNFFLSFLQVKSEIMRDSDRGLFCDIYAVMNVGLWVSQCGNSFGGEQWPSGRVSDNRLGV